MSADLAAAWEEIQERAQRNYRYHCEFCGRFVSFASVKVSYTRWDGERITRGECIRHGSVDVTWGQQ